MPKKPLNRIALCSWLFCCFIFFKGNSQKTTVSIPLTSLLQSLEKAHDVKFSYVDADISGILINTPSSSVLSEILSDLESQTQLRIRKINDRYYGIIKTPNISICAYVFDNYEENTVMGAAVEVLNTDTAVITDIDGRFSLNNVPRDGVICIKYVGYKTLFLNAEELIGRTACQTVLLAQYYRQLQEVVVYEFLTSGLSKQADASIELDIEKFGILPGSIEPDILQTVQALPGIKSVDETVSNINIRGGSNDQNLLLWDGIKMYQSGHFFGLISAFNPYLTEKVTLVKNGTSSEYGDGVSGLISMQTKDNSKTPFFGGAGFNLISGDIYGQMPISKKVALQFSARRSMTDFLNTPTFSRFFNRIFKNDQIVNTSSPENKNRDESFYFYDFSGKVLFDINDKQQLRFSFININNQLEYSEEDNDNGERTQSNLNQGNISVGAQLKSRWSDRFSTSLNTYYTNYALSSLNTSFDEAQQLLQNNKVRETAIKLNTNILFGEQINWLNGLQLSQTDIRNQTNVRLPPFENDNKGVVVGSAFFSELAFRSPDTKLFAKVGVRLNNYRNPNNFSKFIVEPRLNLNYTFANNWKAIVLGEFKSQATNQVVDLEQNFLGIEKRRWVISDGLNLPVTRSKQGSFGVNYDRKNIFIDLQVFIRK